MRALWPTLLLGGAALAALLARRVHDYHANHYPYLRANEILNFINDEGFWGFGGEERDRAALVAVNELKRLRPKLGNHPKLQDEIDRMVAAMTREAA